MKRWLERTCDIRGGELRLVEWFFLFFTGIGMFYTVGATVGDTLFLSSLPKDQVPVMLPWVYAGIAVTSFLAAMAYDALQHRVSRRGAIVGTQVFLALSVLAFRFVVGGEGRFIYLALCVWLEVAALLSITLFFSFAGDYFGARDARRLYGFIAGGMAFGTIVAGNAIRVAVVLVGTRNLLYVGAALLAANALVCWHIHGFATPAPVEVESDAGAGEKVPLAAIFERPYVRLVAVMIATAIMVAVLVDYQMKWVASRMGEQDLAEFFGTFYGLVGVAQILFQFLVVPRLLKRLGIVNCLMILPVAIGLASVLVLAGSAAGFFGLGILAFSATANFLRITLAETLDLPSRELLFLPLPTRIRMRAQPFMDGALAAGARGLSGAVLVVLFAVGVAVETLSAIVVILALLAVGTLLVLRPRYREALAATLRAKDMDAGDIERAVLGPDADPVVLGLLGSGDPAVVQFTLGLLRRRPLGALTEAVSELARGPDPAVAARAVECLGACCGGAHLPAIREALSHGDPDVRRAAVLALGETLGEASFVELSALVDSRDKAVGRAAIVALCKYGGPAGRDRIAPLVRALARSPDVLERASAARLLGSMGRPDFTDVTRGLLADADKDVRTEAVQAVASTSDIGLVPELLEALGDMELRPAAIRALRSMPEDAVAVLVARLRDSASSPADRRLLLRITARVGGSAAAAFLWDEVCRHEAGLAQRATAGSALSSLRRRRGLYGLKLRGFGAVERELFATLALLNDARSQTGAADPFAAHVYGDHARLAVELLLSLYGLRHDPRQIDRILFNLFSDAAALRSRAVELLDEVLPRDVAHRVVTLLKPLVDDEAPAGGGLADKTRERLLAAEPWLTAATVFHLSGGVSYAHASGAALGPMEQELYGRLELVAFLKKAPLFSGVPVNDLVEQARIARWLTLPAGHVLFRQGDAGDALYVIAEGELRVVVNGKEVARLGPSDCVGEMALLDDSPRSATVDLAADSLLLAVDADDLKLLIAAQPAVAKSLLRTLDARIRKTQAGRPEPSAQGEGGARLSHVSFVASPDLVQLIPVISFLGQVELFKDLPLPSLTRLAGIVHEVRCDAGEELFAQGDPGDALYLVCEGEIDVIVDGREVATLGRNACLGEMALIGASARSATARVARDAALLRLWAEDFSQLLATEPEISFALLRTLAARLRHVSTKTLPFLSPAG
ncbi:MAG: cyclic nucleotide-binding domain-containing protein [Deltaproteobacteria bacterium]|nr:cyclic nucleotide-binding domain-containing protein [Deltaproteobacteria bacterium]